MTPPRSSRRATGLAAILGVGAFALARSCRRRRRRRSERRRRCRSRGPTATPPSTRPTRASPTTRPPTSTWSPGRAPRGAGPRSSAACRRGAPPSAPSCRISDMGPPERRGFGGQEPAVAYNVRTNEYLVVWHGDDDAGPLVDDEFEIFAQRLSAGGAEVGRQRPADLRHGAERRHGLLGPESRRSPTTRPATSTSSPGRGTTTPGRSSTTSTRSSCQRLSATGARSAPTTGGSPTWARRRHDLLGRATRPSPTTRRANQYLVAWDGDDDTGPLVDGEDEVFVQRLAANGVEEGAERPARSRTWDPTATPVVRRRGPEPGLQPGERRVPGRLGGRRRHRRARSSDEVEIFVQRLAATGAEVGDERPADLPDGPGRRHHVRRARTPAWRSAPRATSTWWPGRRRTTPGRCSTRRSRSTRSGSARTGPRSGTTTCASPRWAWTATHRATASSAAVAYGSQANEYLIAWDGDTTVAPLVNDESEVYARRFGAGAPVASAVCKVLPPVPPPTPGDPATSRSRPASS